MCKGCRGNLQRLQGQYAKVARAMLKGCWGNVLTCENKVNSFSVKLKVELGLQVREEFDKIQKTNPTYWGGEGEGGIHSTQSQYC